jgi:general secretion pathway protein D
MNLPIEALNAWADHALRFAWPMLWQSSLLIGLLFALDMLMRRKLRPALRYALWLVVLVKLVLPPSLAVPTSPGWWLRPARTVPAEPRRTTVVVTYGPSDSPAFSVAATPAFVAPPRPHLSPAAWAFSGEVAVGIGLLAWMLRRWYQVARDARRATAAPARLSELLPELRQPVRLRLIDQPQSPAVCGLFRPVILLPRSLAEHLPAAQLRAVLLHELLHLRRGDVWVNCAQALLQIAYWWHPLLWFANARIRRVREEAVDDAVMLALNEDADAYAPTLLEVAKLALHRPLTTLGLVGILESRSSLRQRIERLVDFRPPRKAGLTLGPTLAVFGFAALAVPMGEAPATNEVPQVPVNQVVTNGPASDGPSRSGFLDQDTQESHGTIPLYIRTFRVEPNTLIKGLHLTTSPVGTNGLPEVIRPMVDYFKRAGVDLDPTRNPGKSLFYHYGHEGMLLVRATLQDLDIIEREIAALNMPMVETPDVRAGTPPGVSDAETNAPLPPDSLNDVFPQKKIKAGMLTQDGKLLYEMGKLDEAEAKLKLALKEDPNNQATLYYLDLLSKAKSARSGQINRGLLPVPNPSSRTNLLRTSQGRQAIVTKLDRIKLDRVSFDSRPLREVVRSLADETQKRDPDKLSVNIIIESVGRAQVPPEASLDPLTGLPKAGTAAGPLDASTIPITINPPLTNARLADVLEAIVKVARQPIKYSIQEYGVVFSARTGEEPPPLYIRGFKVDPNTLLAGLQTEPGLSLTNGPGAIVPGLRDFLARAGVKLEPPKSIYYNDRQGSLMVRATLQDLDIVEQKIAVLNTPPPQVNIKCMFVEIPQDDTKALGFDWYLGNVLMTNGAVGGQAGATTSNTISPLAINPMGTFPGNPTGPAPTNIAPSSTNGILTSGLRNTFASPPTLTGILTGPQYRAVIQSLQQRSGTELLAQPQVTFMSGRQAQMKSVEVLIVLKGINERALTPPGISTTNEDESGLYVTEPMEFGPMLDVIPSVLADGFTIALTVIPTVTEFLGYREDQTNRVAVYVNGKKKWIIPPEPIVRIRQMSSSVRLWDGQTVVLGGLPSETVSLLKDKVPMLGDLPLVGRLFRSESKATIKKNLLIFVTPTLIDPRGNRVHAADELPFTRDAVPPQPAR